MHYAHLPLFPSFFKYDVVFTSTAYGCLVMKALLGIKKFKWIILDFNILGTVGERKTLKQRIFSWAISCAADGIVAISQAEADGLKKLYPHLAERIIFLHEATDTAFFAPQIAQVKNQVISVGNFGRDFETLIEAMRGIPAELMIAGKFPKKSIATLPSNVRVVQLSHRDILAAYSESKIVVISVKTNTMHCDSVGTLSLGEALSMGKATIVTKTKNMESYVKDGVNGVFVAPRDAEAMRASIIDLLKDDEKRDMLGRHAREYAVTHLNASDFAHNLAKYLKAVV